jgi:hypothetical protein
MRRIIAAAWLCVWLAAGCNSGDDPFKQPKRQVDPGAFGVTVDQGAPVPPPPPAAATGTSAAPGQPLPPPPPPADSQAATPPPPPSAAAQPPAPADDMIRQKAEMGVGKKGRGYEQGLVTTPVAAYFGVRERIVFEIQIPEAMKLYKAMNDFKGPKTHEEFMEKIVKANSIKLPELPNGHRYVYDPEKEELMVERPKP